MDDASLKAALVRYARRMYEKGFVAGTEGNLSVRAGPERAWVTPSGVNKGDVTEELLVLIDFDGNVLAGDQAPTSERFMHLEAYKRRPDVGAVVHGHPIYGTAFAAARQELPRNILPELIATIGDVPIVPYATPSGPKLARAVAPYLTKHHVFLLQNHGALAVGADIREAFHRFEVVEGYARMAWVARSLGGMKPLTPEQIADLPEPGPE